MSQVESKPKKPTGHPEPTAGIVKRLYGTAFRCAKPACREPLYRVNSDNGNTVLNSRVAHIHARGKDGPRWDPAMSTEENRSSENLLLLCIPHASEIDDTPDDFPVSVLRSWKQAQLEEYQRLQRGWEISDEVAADVARVSFGELLDAITDRIPFSPRQRTRAGALDIAGRRLQVARVQRLRSTAPDRVEQVLQWMKDQLDPVVQVLPGQLRILIAPIGAGKTELAACWFEEGLQHARDDDAVSVPVWLEAREAVNGLEEVLRSRLGGDPAAVCRVVVNDLDRVDPIDAERLIREACELVGVWPKVAVLATAQPGAVADSTISLDVPAWTVQRGAQLMEVAYGEPLPWRMWGPETTELMRRPLTALALAARLASGGGAEVSRMQLLYDLPKVIIRERRPAGTSPEVWQALGNLAIQILEARGPVPTAKIGNEAQVWQLTDTRLVIEHDGVVSFALPVFEQHFGAQAITSGTFEVERAVGRISFPTWRYAVAFAIATCSETRDREHLMLRVARTNAAALSWILDEIEPDLVHGGSSAHKAAAPTISAQSASQFGENGTDETTMTLASGNWLREAFEALLQGYGPSAVLLAHHHDDHLVQWGVRLDHGYMTVAEHREQIVPAIVMLPEVTRPHELLSQGWRSAWTYSEPAGIYARWFWARGRILESLERVIYRRALTTSADTRLTHERLWTLACFAISKGGVQLGLDTIPLGALRQRVQEMMEQVRASVQCTWQRGGYTFGSADIIWLDHHLADLDGEALSNPWPQPDLLKRTRWRWGGYSTELAASTTAEILAEAVAGYRDLVETNFPAFGSALGLYSILPLRIHGTISHPQDPDQVPTGLNFAWVPDPELDPHVATPVDLRTEVEPGSWPYWHTPRGPRPNSRAAYHLPMLEDGITPLGGPRPSTNLAYEWLARDLHELGWLKQPITFHD